MTTTDLGNTNGRMREEALDALLRNARLVSHDARKMKTILQLRGLVMPVVDGKEIPLPGYAPYIGQDYFSAATKGRRILSFALSQNLSATDGHAVRWARDWVEGDGLLALDRQNQCGSSLPIHLQISMRPFDTGHLPALCAILRHLVAGDRLDDQLSIYPQIAATNLSKFSFRKDGQKHTTDNPESLSLCWQWFSVHEIQSLKPDFIICAGEDVFNLVRGGLEETGDIRCHIPHVLRVDFPSLQVINSKKKGAYAAEMRSGNFMDIFAGVAAEDLERLVDGKVKLRRILERDLNYFAAMQVRLRSQLQKAGIQVRSL